MSDNMERIRLGVTFTKSYMDGIKSLVRAGVYLDKGSVIRDAVRLLLCAYDIHPFQRIRLEAEADG